MHITAQDKTQTPPRYYRLSLTMREVRRYDNGAMISCGLTVGEGNFQAASLARIVKEGRAEEMTQDEWNHSGCQSACIRRGNKECRW